MSCGMCEAHVQDTVAQHFKTKKAKASRSKKKLIVISEQEISEDDFHKILDPTGYRIISYRRAEAIKKLLGWS